MDFDPIKVLEFAVNVATRYESYVSLGCKSSKYEHKGTWDKSGVAVGRGLIYRIKRMSSRILM